MEKLYDFIIVGAGSAGCLLANRLSANPAHKVLLVEAGSSDRRFWSRLPIGYYKTIYNKTFSRVFETEPCEGSGGRTIKWPRGRIIGGSSSINGLIFIRGQKDDFDDWQTLGATGWDFQTVLPFFRKLEGYKGGESQFRGSFGELKVDDLNITLADGAADSAAANGAGITIDGAGATITYAHTGTKFVFNKPIDTGANNITTTGTVAGDHSGDGSALTALNGSQVTTGTVAAARVATLNQDTTGTAGIASTVTLADESTDTTCFPTFSTAATGAQALKTDSVLTYDSSNGTLGATTFSGVATSAQYADLAEKYIPDSEYPPRTVLTVGVGAEVTWCKIDSMPAGVVSTQPAYLMNSELANGVAVALVGRVPVRTVGSVIKGQVVYCDNNGVASATSQGQKVGIALETNEYTGEKLVECMLKV